MGTNIVEYSGYIMNPRIRHLIGQFKRKQLYAGALVFSIALVFRLLYFTRALQIWGGVRTAGDTPAFEKTCGLLVADPIGSLSTIKGLQYLGFTVPYCIVEGVADGSGIAWVLIQIVLSAGTATLIYFVGRRLINPVAGLVAGLSFALLFDVVRYTVFLLSETTFIFVFSLCLWAITHHWENPSRTTRGLAIGSLGWLVITRPFGMPIVFGWLLFDLFPRGSKYRVGLIPRPIAVLGVILLPTAVLVTSSAPTKLAQVEQGFRGGWILFKGQTEFFLAKYNYTARPADGFIGFLVANIDHVIIMMILRTMVFFMPLIDNFASPFWNIVNIVVLGPLLIGSAIGIFRSWNMGDVDVLILLLTPIVVVTGVVAITLVSIGWRFRAPLTPAFALLTGYAVASIRSRNKM